MSSPVLSRQQNRRAQPYCNCKELRKIEHEKLGKEYTYRYDDRAPFFVTTMNNNQECIHCAHSVYWATSNPNASHYKATVSQTTPFKYKNEEKDFEEIDNMLGQFPSQISKTYGYMETIKGKWYK